MIGIAVATMPEGMVNGPEMGLPKKTVLEEAEDLSVLFKAKGLHCAVC